MNPTFIGTLTFIPVLYLCSTSDYKHSGNLVEIAYCLLGSLLSSLLQLCCCSFPLDISLGTYDTRVNKCIV